jgi:hypothetical protein
MCSAVLKAILGAALRAILGAAQRLFWCGARAIWREGYSGWARELFWAAGFNPGAVLRVILSAALETVPFGAGARGMYPTPLTRAAHSLHCYGFTPLHPAHGNMERSPFSH